MRTVTVSADIAASHEAILDELSPREIIEYEQTYDVIDVSESGGGWVITAISVESEIDMELFFEERPDGFVYELASGGPFEELNTSLTVHDATGDNTDDADLMLVTESDEKTIRVTMMSEFTFGGWFSPVIDWLASSNRREELQRALVALAVDVGAIEHSGEASGGSSDDTN